MKIKDLPMICSRQTRHSGLGAIVLGSARLDNVAASLISVNKTSMCKKLLKNQDCEMVGGGKGEDERC